MDECKTGEISARQFYTLCWGLGYDAEETELDTLILRHTKGNVTSITVDIVLNILLKVCLV